ncbi:uncharacterized protein LOC105186428 [Harpegnathos saltator]|uniref:Uncharacterized protein n=1 Tax=Harpegnathos saltator TaxID=610380 RepID=E2BTN4_HARSA|nr:uncharacterized protein LOC105186428 [Harpegnathos saltator]EFN80949.1 hypothetical protein EAI_08629 [Harpegnathos saltator]
MDADLLRAILRSFNDSENVTESEDYKNISKEVVLQSNAISDALYTSLSNLLCYKVSKQAYQRYSVRLLIIDIVRRWCKTTSNFNHLRIFTSEENNLKFVTNLLDKCLTNDILTNCCSNDALISLTTAVMYLSMENPSLMHHLDRLLVRLLRLKTDDKIERLLHDVLSTDLDLKLSTKEEIYLSQRSSLIERPLLDSFTCMFSDANEENCLKKQRDAEKTLSRLLALSAASACVFQLVFSFLKELLVQLQYAPAVIDFINSILKRVDAYCEDQGKEILDLYPRRLCPCVILLKIKPEHHTAQTKEYILQTVKRIFVENKNVVLILMSQFPEWLEFLPAYITNDAQS